MTPEQSAAFIHAQSVAAQVTAFGMIAANKERESKGFALAYDEKAFIDLIDEFRIGRNTVLTSFQGVDRVPFSTTPKKEEASDG